MQQIIKILNKYNVVKIFIDGALFRKSTASFKIADAVILATGASYSKDIDKVVKDTSLLLDELMLEKIDNKLADLLKDATKSFVMDIENNITPFNLDTVLNNENTIKKYLDKNSRYLYLEGALSNKLIQMIIDKRYELNDLTIIVKDATHIILDAFNLEKLKLINTKLKVIYRINVLLLTYNPHSSLGYDFDNEIFKKKLEEKIKLPIINVLKDLE